MVIGGGVREQHFFYAGELGRLFCRSAQARARYENMNGAADFTGRRERLGGGGREGAAGCFREEERRHD